MELTDVFLTQYFEIWLCVSHFLISLNWRELIREWEELGHLDGPALLLASSSRAS